jgi:hypothetical protein
MSLPRDTPDSETWLLGNLRVLASSPNVEPEHVVPRELEKRMNREVQIK